MASTFEVASEKRAAAMTVADAHYRLDSAVERIYLIESDREDELPEPIKLLEVDVEAIPAGIVPITVGSHVESDRWFPIVVIDITPDEFEQLKRDELQLPAGWSIGEQVARPSDMRTARKTDPIDHGTSVSNAG